MPQQQLRDLALTATERTAITALLEAEQLIRQRQEWLDREKSAVANDIERRLKLPAGALGDEPTHHVNLDDWRVEEIPSPNGKP